jgi:hypothetical protein
VVEEVEEVEVLRDLQLQLGVIPEVQEQQELLVVVQLEMVEQEITHPQLVVAEILEVLVEQELRAQQRQEMPEI